MALTQGSATGQGRNEFAIPPTMKAWVLGDPEQLSLVDKPVPEPGRAEVLVRIDAIAVCATDIEILSHGLPAMIDGELPFNKGFTPGHEYMGTTDRFDGRCGGQGSGRATGDIDRNAG
jgi:L-iditol 2-dehydrogenase